MGILLLGLVLFMGIHLLPGFTGLRSQAVQALGPRGYQAMFSVVSLAGFLLIIYGKSRAGFEPVWQPFIWGKTAAMLLMLPACILLVAAYLPGNTKRFTRHPMLWSVTLWAIAHLLTNGDLASAMLFGAFGLFALYDMYSANRRGAKKLEQSVPVFRDVVVIIIGCGVFGGLLWLHPLIAGVAVIQ